MTIFPNPNVQLFVIRSLKQIAKLFNDIVNQEFYNARLQSHKTGNGKIASARQ